MKPHVESHGRTDILVAEDDETLSRVIAAALEKAGFTTHVANDGVAAINYIMASKPDLMILDLKLPRLQGYDICTMVRESDSVRHTPIIVISGQGSLGHKLHLFKLGADDYVTKPFSIDELVARVEAVLARARRARAQAPFGIT